MDRTSLSSLPVSKISKILCAILLRWPKRPRFSGVCECPLGTETFRGVCMPARRPLGTGCYSSANCHKFGYCDNGYCTCKAGYAAVDSFCLPPARPIVDDPRAFVDPDKKAQVNT